MLPPPLRPDFQSWNFSSVATDAFGNALGNSFVANRVKAEEDKLKAAAKADSAANVVAALASGADPASPEALQQVVDKYVAPAQRDQVRFDKTDGNLRISLEGGNSAGAVNLTTGVTDIGMVRQQHEALIDFIFANNLTTDSHSALLGISQQLYTQRSDYYSDDNIAGRMKIARDDGITRGIYNVNQATMLRKASFTGFDGNLTGADLWGAAGLVQNDFVNEPVEKPVERTVFLLRPFCLLFVSNFACFWWEFQDKIYWMPFHLNNCFSWPCWALSPVCLS